MSATVTIPSKDTLDPRLLRKKIRSGEHTGPTSGLCPGYIQANMVILPASVADDFHRFCTLNPKPCPLLERIDAGKYQPSVLTTDGTADSDVTDIRTGEYRALLQSTQHAADHLPILHRSAP